MLSLHLLLFSILFRIYSKPISVWKTKKLNNVLFKILTNSYDFEHNLEEKKNALTITTKPCVIKFNHMVEN